MPTVYAAMRDGLLVVDVDAPAASRPRLDGHALECVAAEVGAPDRVLCGTFDAGLHRSTDGGETFERVGADVLPEAVTSIAVDPTDPEVVWAGTEPSAVYRSTDGGRSWVQRPGLADLPSADEWYFPPRPHTHHVRWIEPDPNEPERLYVGIEAGAFVITPDAGETWHERPPGARIDNHSLATHPDAPGRVYAAAGDGYAESSDAGETWAHPQTGLDHRYCWSVAPDPADPETVLLSSARGPGLAHSLPGESHLYRRRGGGEWERLDGDVPTGEGVLRAVIEPAGPGAFWALTNRGLFSTGDAGGSWEAIDVDWPGRFESQAPRGLAVVPSA